MNKLPTNCGDPPCTNSPAHVSTARNSPAHVSTALNSPAHVSSARNSLARYFPHQAAGFRSNPFRALTDTEWAECAIVGEEIEAAFNTGAAHLQVLGGMGAGKTTTLLGLKRIAVDARVSATYEYLADGQDQLTTDPASCALLLLDEAQRLAQSQLACLLDQCARPLPAAGREPSIASRGGLRLVFASHDDLAAHFAARGLPLVTCSVDHLPVAAWRAILDARLAAAALPGRPHATLSDDAVALLIQTFGPDRRAAVALLYEVFQPLRAPLIIDASHVRAALSDFQ